MRIADHAVAMQSSQALQQPSNTAHQQQVISPEIARETAEEQARRHAAQVNQSEETKGRTIDSEEKGKREGKNPRRREKESAKGVEKDRDEASASGPDEEGHLDILV